MPRATLATLMLAVVFGTVLVPTRMMGADESRLDAESVPLTRSQTIAVREIDDLFKQDRLTEAIALCQEILDQTTDRMFRPADVLKDSRSPNDQTRISLHTWVRLRLRSLPPKSRPIYDRLAGPAVERLLRTARETQRIEPIHEAVRRYGESRAVEPAWLLLALHHRDRGEVHAAQRASRRANRTDLPTLPAKNDAETFLTDGFGWLTEGGHPTRTATHRFPKAITPRPWTADLLLDPRRPENRLQQRAAISQVRDILDRAVSEGQGQPAGVPLASGSVLLTRSVGEIIAFDRRTGERLWTTLPDPAYEHLLAPDRQRDRASEPSMRQGLSRRLLHDRTFGMMASDGERLYSVEEVGFPDPNENNTDWPRSSNTLVAYALGEKKRIGQRVWTRGGRANDPLFTLPLAGTFFLGAPLPVGDELHILGERDGVTSLYTLSAATGDEFLSFPLWQNSRSAEGQWHRRVAGLSPSVNEGVLIVRDDLGRTLAIDTVTRTLLWEHLPATDANPRRPIGPGGNTGDPHIDGDRLWFHQPTRIIADSVILPGRGNSREVTCLDLSTGKTRWTFSADGQRTEGLQAEPTRYDRIEAVYEKVVVISGEKFLTGIHLRDGSLAWQTQLPGAPGGSGPVIGNRLYLPLRLGVILPIGLQDGATGEPIPLPKGMRVGNGIYSDGHLIVQGTETLTAIPIGTAP